MDHLETFDLKTNLLTLCPLKLSLPSLKVAQSSWLRFLIAGLILPGKWIPFEEFRKTLLDLTMAVKDVPIAQQNFLRMELVRDPAYVL